MKRANAVGKMTPIDLLGTGLPQTFSLEKKKIQEKQEGAIKQGMLIY